MSFQKAVKSKSKLKCALIGPSGSGKTWGALLIAKGMGGKVGFIDTENGSASLYADHFDFDVNEISPPFTPEKYMNAIKEAEKANFHTLIIDSLSHAWAGTGGILDILDVKTKGKAGGNSFAAWKDVTPIQNKLIDTILQSKLHIIVAMRTKTHYDIQKDEKTGKSKPVKLGLAPVQRAESEYDFTLVLDVNQNHYASQSKDRTHLFADDFIITEETGIKLMDWLNSGVDIIEKPIVGEPVKKPPQAATPEQSFEDLVTEVEELAVTAKSLGIIDDKRIQAWFDAANAQQWAEMTTKRLEVYKRNLSVNISDYRLANPEMKEAIGALTEAFDGKLTAVKPEEVENVEA